MKIKTIRSKEDVTEFVNSDLYQYAEDIKVSDVEMEKNLFEHLEKYEQFSFDMTTGIIYAVIQNGKLIYQGEIE